MNVCALLLCFVENIVHEFYLISPVDGIKRDMRVVKASKLSVGGKHLTGHGSRKSRTKHYHRDDLQSSTNVQVSVFAKPLLYAFPSFDKSDALIFLPTSLSRHMNSGDTEATSKLILSHLDRDCLINLEHYQPGLLNTKSFVKMLDLITNLHPDSIMCAQGIKVDGNQISASLFAKFTDNKVIYESVRSTLKDPALRAVFGFPRAVKVRKSLENAPRGEEESQQIITFADSDEDLLVYVHVELTMTVDELTKKVSKFYVTSRLTSMHPAVTTNATGTC